MYRFYFERLDVWNNSRELTKSIYEASASFPSSELYGLTSQLRRSSVSIASNIAEGFSRNTDKEKLRFINISYSSLWETLNHLILCKDLGYLNNKTYEDIREESEIIARQLSGLMKSLKQ
ncbi:four helix bundle protein [Robertkochia marina]|uniref:Four helix bundle protein n=1 Tax=Robertkochia marina TaxID=1227945 RepID=A0A4S3M112_9FLAO|nr:four helix bundle protein [Robertkochia marina]THD67717.1 four helix bundle protein [Robertkochia marina]TRZ43448.1 four helix bundle protein [Robertkochia marina]